MSAVEEPARPLLGYIAKFKDFVKEGPAAQLYYPDTEAGRAQAESFVQREDVKGYSIYSCIGRMRSPPRNKENVAELSRLILDLDLRNMREGREQVLDCLRKLIIPPDQIDDSGGGLHPIWHFKEPLTDEAGMAQAEAIMRRLVSLLAGDPKPTHRAALLRHVGSHNSRYGDWHECRIIESTGKRCDISEFEDMFDLYGEIPLLHYKEEEAPLFNSEGKRLPIDLEAMRYQGKVGMNDTFLGYLGSALGKGEALADVIETIIEAAERNCRDDPNRPRWRHDLAEKASWWLEKHPEWTGTALSKKHEDAWLQAEGKRRRLVWKGGRGLEVRTYVAEVHNLDEHRERRREEQEQREQEQEEQEQRQEPPKGRRRPEMFSSHAFTDNFVPPDYVLVGVLQRRFLYSCTGATGDGKTTWLLLLAAHVALKRALGSHEVKQGAVVVLAGENPDDVRMRWIAMAEHMGFDPNTIDVHFVPGVFPIKTIKREIESAAKEKGITFSLVIVDTSAAYFPGNDENNNTQAGNHARELRTLVELPGGPCVLVSCHPTKNADRDNLLPRGGGAYVAEVDGNLICRKSGGDNVSEIHWHGKFRGPDFNPLAFETRQVSSIKLVDSDGSSIPTVIGFPLDELEHSSRRAESRGQEDKVLLLMVGKEGLSLAQVAQRADWLTKAGEPNRSKAQRVMNRLRDAHLVKNDRGDWQLTEAGSKAARRAEGRWS